MGNTATGTNTRLRYIWYKRKDGLYAADATINLGLDLVTNYESWANFVILRDVF